MLNNAQGISDELLNQLAADFQQNKLARLMQNACSKTPISDIVYCPSSKVGNAHQFSIDIKTLSATNQKSSGRCWLFAGTNVLREVVAKKINAKEFELSQNYLAFYDKLEKCNFALESIIDFAGEDHDDRTYQTILGMPVGDGGQWDMFKSLVKKYGVVPKNVMDETFSSSNTRDSGYILNTAIRKFAADSQQLYKEGKQDEIRPLKNKVLAELYRVLSIAFGQPVTEFGFEYVDKDGNYHVEKGLNPHTFYEKYIGEDIDDYVSIINSPTDDKPFYETFTVDYIGNVIGGDPIFYLNLPMNELKQAVINSLKAGEIVWFGSDCGKFADRTGGCWNPEQYNYEDAFQIELAMSKQAMLDYHQSAMNHAMVITGVNLENDQPTKWKIENSWGDTSAFKGYYTATDSWFDGFVFQAVVNKKYLTEAQRACLEKAPKHLTPWDPMGTLAD